MSDAFKMDEVREEISKAGCTVEWIGHDANGLIWAVVRSKETGKRYKWPGMFAWKAMLPGETRPDPRGRGTKQKQGLLF